MERPYDNLDPQDVSATPTRSGDPAQTWASTITRAVALQIRFWRERRGLSAQQLSDRTRELGHQVPRSVISNIENGRRDVIGIAELLILGAALDVPPTMFLAAVGRAEAVEILPQVVVTPWLARGWLIGAVEPSYEPSSPADWQDARRAVALYDIHRLLVREYQQVETRLTKLREHVESHPTDSEDGTTPDQILVGVAVDLAASLNRIRSHRRRIRKEGLLLPDLPPVLSGALQDTDFDRGA